MTDKLYVGDIGTEIILDCGSDISTATKVEIHAKLPDGTTAAWEGEIYNTNYVKYMLQAGDLPSSGNYLLQAYVELPEWKGLGNTAQVKVYNPFS